VGTVFTNGGAQLGPLIDRWDGDSWSFQHAPTPPGATDAQVLDVSCTSDADCFAVGESNGTRGRTLVEHWDGTAWSIVRSPNPHEPKFPNSQLNSVSCVSSSFCVAVGESLRLGGGTRLLVERWDGARWTVEAASAKGISELWAVWCQSATACMATGVDRGRAFADRWNGSAWTPQAPPMPPGARRAILWGVVCQAPTACIAAGSSSASKGSTLAEAYSK